MVARGGAPPAGIDGQAIRGPARDADGNRSQAGGPSGPTTPAPPDTDADGVPDVLEIVFGTQSNANATSDSSLGLKINRPIQ